METRKLFVDLVLFFLLLHLQTSDNKRINSKAIWKRERGGKFLFNIVQFSNSPCNASSSEVGLCYTHSQCEERGGSQGLPCAAGFGVCCLFRATGAGGDSRRETEKISYFSNTDWPLPSSLLQFATHSVWIDDSDVCQVRLDFDTFELAGPSLTHFPIGECDLDRLVIFSVNQDIGLSGGNELCGNLTGQHIYLDVDPVNILDPIRLFMFVGNSGAAEYLWNIKITLIDCKLNSEIQAPPGCRQYFPQSTGTFSSLNYAGGPGSPYLANTRYAVCFRRRPGLCGLKLSAAPGEFIMNSNLAVEGEATGPDCHNYINNSTNDYIQVLSGYNLLGTNRIEESYFCGGGINTEISPIYATHGPLVVMVTTDDGVKSSDGMLYPAADDDNSTVNQVDLINERERGFRLTYTLTPC